MKCSPPWPTARRECSGARSPRRSRQRSRRRWTPRRPPRRSASKMGKIVVTEFVSLDGVMEDPGGAEDYEHGGWTFEYDRGEGDKFKLEEAVDSEALLLGRRTYEGFAEAWPSRE